MSRTRGWLVASLLINGVLIGHWGLARYLRSRYPGETYAVNRASLFERLPTTPGAIVFLGDSLTDQGEWAERASREPGA